MDMSPDVTISGDLKALLAKCKPGQSKEMNISVMMGKDNKVTLSPSGKSEEAYESEPSAPKPPKKKMVGRPKPVMDAIDSMYA